LKADLKGERAPDDPRRFTSIELKYTITGVVPNEAVERAIELSREKYCSVWHSMRQDIKFDVTFIVTPGM
jgi:putative redox protein